MRRLFLPRDHIYLNLLKSCGLQPAVQIALREPQPSIPIELVCLVEVVLEQIENHNLSARPQEAVRGLNRLRRICRVMQRLTQNNQIDTLRIDRRILQIAQAKLEILKVVLLCLGRAELDHLL